VYHENWTILSANKNHTIKSANVYDRLTPALHIPAVSLQLIVSSAARSKISTGSYTKFQQSQQCASQMPAMANAVGIHRISGCLRPLKMPFYDNTN